MINGTAGNDHLRGTNGPDEFDLSQGGNDLAYGGGGADTFFFGNAFTSKDHVFGGGGSDTLVLDGDYLTTPLKIKSGTLTGIETMQFNGAHDYYINLADGNLAAGQTMHIQAAVTGTHFVIFNALDESHGNFVISGSAGGDVLQTGAGDDIVYGGADNDTLSTSSGHDQLYGGEGDDPISFYSDGALDAGDRVDGGAGNNTLVLFGSYSSLVLQKDTVLNIQQINLLGDGPCTFDFSASHINQTRSIQILAAGPSSFNFTAAGSTGFGYTVLATEGSDVLIGSRGNDDLRGGGSADTMEGGGGLDAFIYDAVSDSTGKHYDTIDGFDTHDDFIDAEFVTEGGRVNAVDASVTHGTLSAASFDSDLATAIRKSALGAHNAVLFQASTGDLAGEWFLIIDGNGKAGYQANRDLVVHLSDLHHAADISFDNFGLLN